MDVFQILNKNKLNYVIIKYPFLIKKEISDVDVLLDEKSYGKFKQILLKQGFRVHNDEKVEKYKTMMKKDIFVHLHREIAWGGLKVLDSKAVLRRKQKFKNFFVPSFEDILLINVMHLIFEVRKMREYEQKLFTLLLKKSLDFGYIDSHLKKFGLSKIFYKVLKNRKINNKMIINAYFSRLLKKDLLSGIFGLFIVRFRALLRIFSLKRRGKLVALIGPDGSGKTTVADELNKNFGFKTVYGGWKHHILPTAKLQSAFGKTKKGREMVAKAKEKRKKSKKSSVFREFSLLHFFFEHLIRYLLRAYPKLRKNKNVVVDRYFYDIFLQDPKAFTSRVINLCLKVFPKPDLIVNLYNKPEIILKRKKELTKAGIAIQQERIAKLSKKIKIVKITTDIPALKIAKRITEKI